MSSGQRASLGAVVFAVHVMRGVPQAQHAAWGEALVLFAALVVVPLLLDLLRDSTDDPRSAGWFSAAVRWQLPAAVGLVVSYNLGRGWVAPLCALPWVVLLSILATVGWHRMAHAGFASIAARCDCVGMIYAAVAALWLLADRLALQPLGFDADIVLLTAVHFHYAGLVLPVLTALVLRSDGCPRLVRGVGFGVVVGIPAVAVGITSSQFRLSPALEAAAALTMATGGMAVAVLHLKLGLQSRARILQRGLWTVAGLSLGAGMALAAVYGVRSFVLPLPWLDIPAMRALHGTLNSIGFGFCGVLAWWQEGKSR